MSNKIGKKSLTNLQEKKYEINGNLIVIFTLQIKSEKFFFFNHENVV